MQKGLTAVLARVSNDLEFQENVMRKWGLCLMLGLIQAGVALPVLAANRVTVIQLEKILSASQGKSDAEVARQLAELELTERLSSARMQQLRGSLPGERSQQALVALADTSAFLDPPSTDMPATATPDGASQRRMMALTVDYLGKTVRCCLICLRRGIRCGLNRGRSRRPRVRTIRCGWLANRG